MPGTALLELLVNKTDRNIFPRDIIHMSEDNKCPGGKQTEKGQGVPGTAMLGAGVGIPTGRPGKAFLRR